jgi:putative addiction module CopG family antidote
VNTSPDSEASSMAIILFGCPALPYHRAMDGMTLPPELERFAEDAIAAGHYRDLAEVVAAGLSLLKRQEAARTAFVTSLDDALANGERDGFLTIEEVERDMDDAIAEVIAKTRS